MHFSDASAMQKEREERVRKIREQQEDERKKKVEELKNHVSFFIFLFAWSRIDTIANCNKVEYDKIWKYIGKITQKRKNFENLLTSVEVTC